ncbi:MAG: glycosyltransferase [Coriobacteriia bacterium]|nr:glycosyltransferase [Coriobacteriia bacterium]MCL2536778.1 glycosyltransferase [Coriobacteriia bacterium]
MHLVSIIIPVFNGEAYLAPCLDSVLAQTHKNLEIIVVDDGSYDETPAILMHYSAEHAHLTVFTTENKGQGHARNFALARAKGEYVMFLDADDTLLNQAVELSLRQALCDESDVVVFDWEFYFDAYDRRLYLPDKSVATKSPLRGDECLDYLRLVTYFPVNKLYRSDFLAKHKIRFGEDYLYEDVPFWVAAVTAAKKISTMSKPLYVIRVNQSSSTGRGHETDWHSSSFLKAVEAALAYTRSEYKPQYSYLYESLIMKFYVYYKRRVPKKKRAQFASDFAAVLSQVELRPGQIASPFVSVLHRLRIIQGRRADLLVISCSVMTFVSILGGRYSAGVKRQLFRKALSSGVVRSKRATQNEVQRQHNVSGAN